MAHVVEVPLETPHRVVRAAAEVAVRRELEHADGGERLLKFADGFSRTALLAARDVLCVVVALLQHEAGVRRGYGLQGRRAGRESPVRHRRPSPRWV